MAKADVLITEDPGFESQVSHYFFHVAELTVSATKLFVALVINKARLWMTLEVPDWSLMPGPPVDFNQQGILGRCAKFLNYMLKTKVQRTPVSVNVIILQVLDVWRTLEVLDWILMTKPHVDFDQQ